MAFSSLGQAVMFWQDMPISLFPTKETNRSSKLGDMLRIQWELVGLWLAFQDTDSNICRQKRRNNFHFS